MKLKKLIILFIGAALLFICVATVILMRYKDTSFKEIKFETVASYEADIDTIRSIGCIWHTLRHPSYNGFFPDEILDDLGVNRDDLRLDYNRYTYVVTFRHELLNISYSYSQMKNRTFIKLPKQFVGNVDLKSETTDNVYIYRVKKMDIDCDFHDRTKGVSFID
ncbi:MAG: hypothetical protein LBS36_10040 [Oscillospiraceae bacterium]|jgi:hypothetical protein|nr:hypothetical protein [Oscillospiraceae bacterium]